MLAHGNACWTRGAGQHLDARGPSRIRTSQGPAPLRPRARASARTALPPRERVHRTDGFAHARALARVPTRKQADATLRQDVIGRHLPRSARVPRLTLGGRCGGSATNGLSKVQPPREVHRAVVNWSTEIRDQSRGAAERQHRWRCGGAAAAEGAHEVSAEARRASGVRAATRRGVGGSLRRGRRLGGTSLRRGSQTPPRQWRRTWGTAPCSASARRPRLSIRWS